MPLRNGCSKKDFQFNVAELIRSGRPSRVAVAIAYAHSRKQKCKVKRKK